MVKSYFCLKLRGLLIECLAFVFLQAVMNITEIRCAFGHDGVYPGLAGILFLGVLGQPLIGLVAAFRLVC